MQVARRVVSMLNGSFDYLKMQTRPDFSRAQDQEVETTPQLRIDKPSESDAASSQSRRFTGHGRPCPCPVAHVDPDRVLRIVGRLWEGPPTAHQ